MFALQLRVLCLLLAAAGCLQAAWTVGPEFHLRLLHALCNDVVNCYNMKAEISSRWEAHRDDDAGRVGGWVGGGTGTRRPTHQEQQSRSWWCGEVQLAVQQAV